MAGRAVVGHLDQVYGESILWSRRSWRTSPAPRRGSVRGSELVDTLPEAPGRARKAAILEAVRGGHVVLDWSPIEVRDDRTTGTSSGSGCRATSCAWASPATASALPSPAAPIGSSPRSWAACSRRRASRTSSGSTRTCASASTRSAPVPRWRASRQPRGSDSSSRGLLDLHLGPPLGGEPCVDGRQHEQREHRGRDQPADDHGRQRALNLGSRGRRDRHGNESK